MELDPLLRLPRVLEATGLSRASVYREMDAGRFPLAYQLTEHTVGWRASEVQEWIESRQRIEPTPERATHEIPV